MTGRASKGTGRGSGELVIFRFLFCFWLGKYVYSMTIQVVYLWCMCFSSMNDAYNLKIKSFFKKKIYLCRIFIKDKVEFKVIFFPNTLKINSWPSCIQHCRVTFNVMLILLSLCVCLYIFEDFTIFLFGFLNLIFLILL